MSQILFPTHLLLKILPDLTKECILIDHVGTKAKCSICCPLCKKFISLSAYSTSVGISFRLNNFARHVVTAHIEIAAGEHNCQDSVLEDVRLCSNRSSGNRPTLKRLQNRDSNKENVRKEPTPSTSCLHDVHQESLSELTQKIQLLETQNEKLKAELVVMKNFELNNKVLVDDITTLKKNAESSQLAMNELKKRYDAVLSENINLEASNLQSKADHEICYGHLVESNGQLKKAKEELDAMNAKISETVVLNSNLQERYDVSIVDVGRLEAERNKLIEERNLMKQSIGERIENLLQVQKNLKTHNEQLKLDVQRIREEVQDQIKSVELSVPFNHLMRNPENDGDIDMEANYLREKINGLETDLDKVKSELHLSQLERRDLLHSLLDLQGKVRTMARLRPAIDPFTFHVNSHQNHLKCESFI